jgi:hypothetical protein
MIRKGIEFGDCDRGRARIVLGGDYAPDLDARHEFLTQSRAGMPALSEIKAERQIYLSTQNVTLQSMEVDICQHGPLFLSFGRA